MVLSRGAATGAGNIQHERTNHMDFYRVLKSLGLSFVRADFGPAAISSNTSKRGMFKSLRLLYEILRNHHHSLVALGGISNNFLYARSANNRGTSSLPVAHV